MRGGVRGQVTAFVLLGLAVVIVFLILLALRNALLARTMSEPTNGYDATLVQNYVDRCIDLAATEGFKNLGHQGLRLYDSQGGLTPDSDPLTLWLNATDADNNPTSERIHVGFGLINDSDFPFHPPFPRTTVSEYTYPFPDVGIDGARILAEEAKWLPDQYDGAFGQYALPGLCDAEGPNNLSQTNPRLRCARPLFAADDVSVQASLAAFIRNRLTTCVDTERIGELLGADVTEARVNVTITLAKYETLVDVDLPLQFSSDGGGFRTASFGRRYPVRMHAFALYAHNLLKEASKNASFRINETASYRAIGGYDVYVVKERRLTPVETGGRTDLSLVTVLDPKSRVDKQPWQLEFIIQDRPPILDQYQSLLFPVDDQPPTLQVRALDPDGDGLNATLELFPSGSPPSTSFTAGPGQPPLTLNIETLDAGTYKAFLTVTDPSGLTDWQRFMLTVTPSESS